MFWRGGVTFTLLATALASALFAVSLFVAPAPTAGAQEVETGAVVITEVIQNPAAVSDSVGEWFEIYNPTDELIDLNNWTLADDDIDTHTIFVEGGLLLAPGTYMTFGVSGDPALNGGAPIDYVYDNMFLSNGSDELVLVDANGGVVDRIAWDNGISWPDPNGASMSLGPASTDVSANNDGTNWCEGTTAFGTGDLGSPGESNPDCGGAPPPPTIQLIHQIQGSGPVVAIRGPVQVEAVVTSRFERDDALDGFFIQEEDAHADTDPATSEGIFVHCRGNCPADLEVGDLVAVSGYADDFFGMSQINMTGGAAAVLTRGVAALPSPSTLTLPAPGSTSAETTFESLEGMVVTIPNTLAVSEYFQLARFGQVVLTDTARPYQFTHDSPPSPAGYQAYLADLATRRIILDDDNNDNNDAISDGPDEPYFYADGGLSVTNKFRGGDTITGTTGVLHWSWAGSNGTDAWRIRPIDGIENRFAPVNHEPAAAPHVGGSLTVAAFNVLNYFATIDDGASTCGPVGEGCRGANSWRELDRQRDKTVAAILEMDADVVGLVELENDGDDASVADLVAGLNAAGGAYDYIATGFLGVDAIKVGYIYQPATVTPAGDFAVLDSSVDPTFFDDKNRPVLIQTFDENATGERLTVAVNHLKSKGSDCNDLGDPDRGDGQANCPGVRTAGAEALANFLATDPTDSGDPDFLIIGDLNAYAMEDPIAALMAAGYTDLLAMFGGPAAYTYVFDGQLGYLDYGLANPDLLGQVAGTAAWAINADEVNVFDYNDEIRDPGEASFRRESAVLPIYAPDWLRSSDHDPVLVGLALDSIPDNPECAGHPATIIGTPGADTIIGTNHDDVIVTFGGDDYVDGGNGTDIICTGYGNDEVIGGNGADIIHGGPGDDMLWGDNGDDALDGGAGTDVADGGRGEDACTDTESTTACE